MPRLGELLYATHDGLRDEYEVSCPELDFHSARNLIWVLGARLMGVASAAVPSAWSV